MSNVFTLDPIVLFRYSPQPQPAVRTLGGAGATRDVAHTSVLQRSGPWYAHLQASSARSGKPKFELFGRTALILEFVELLSLRRLVDLATQAPMKTARATTPPT